MDAAYPLRVDLSGIIEGVYAMKRRKKKYEVFTWDAEKEEWNPQEGVRRGPYTLFGLRRALRRLRDLGYPCDYQSNNCGDPSVLVRRR